MIMCFICKFVLWEIILTDFLCGNIPASLGLNLIHNSEWSLWCVFGFIFWLFYWVFLHEYSFGNLVDNSVFVESVQIHILHKDGKVQANLGRMRENRIWLLIVWYIIQASQKMLFYSIKQ